MRTVLVTQRVDVIEGYGERRDALDQQWIPLLHTAGLQPVPVPNNRAWVESHLAEHGMRPLLLTGGNSLGKYGGNAPERDEVEHLLLNTALKDGVPVLGVCRGMQVILDFFGAPLQPVEGHVAPEQDIAIDGITTTVNSYHDFGCRRVPAEMEIWATADDGIVKAVRHPSLPICGIMWHPERIQPFRSQDIALLRGHLEGEAP